MIAVRIKLTEHQQALLRPIIDSLIAVGGEGAPGATMGQVDYYTDGTYDSAWFTVLEPARARRVAQASKPQDDETGIVWLYDEMDEPDEPDFDVMTSDSDN